MATNVRTASLKLRHLSWVATPASPRTQPPRAARNSATPRRDWAHEKLTILQQRWPGACRHEELRRCSGEICQ
eukprot:7086844-Pyramimonas_sp.AAC.1